jgi:hypothetical protein
LEREKERAISVFSSEDLSMPLRRILVMVAFLLTAVPASSRADPELAMDHRALAIGFTDFDAPLGVRWWLGDSRTVGVDLGIGFLTGDSGRSQVLTAALGIPIRVTSWDRLKVSARPGFKYQRQNLSFAFPFAADPDQNVYSVSAGLEPEFFLIENFSVSAAVHVQARFFDPDEGSGSSEAFSRGETLLFFGMHAYLFGPGR